MSADGAHLGVSASRALSTILGGKPQPADEERLTQQEFAERVHLVPFNLSDIDGEDPYSGASLWLARRYLAILRDAPAIDANTAWEVFKTKWPNDVEDANGMTGFMHGWAWNAARHSLNYGPQQNPAILTFTYRGPPPWQRWTSYLMRLWAKRYGWLKIKFA